MEQQDKLNNEQEERFGMVRLLIFNHLIDLRPQEKELREKVTTAKNEKQKEFFLKALTNVQGWIKECSEAYELLNREQEVKVCDARKAEATTEADLKTPLISKGGAEVEKLADTHSKVSYARAPKQSQGDAEYIQAVSKNSFIAGYNQALTQKAGDGWKEITQALKPFADMFGELTESKVRQKGKVFSYNRADITVDDLHHAFLAYKKLEKQ